MAVECLHALIDPDIPHRYCFVARSTHEAVTEGFPLNAVHGVYVASESKPGFLHIHVPEFNGVIHGRRQQKVARIMICYFPDGLTML